jgi:hypothetical protein
MNNILNGDFENVALGFNQFLAYGDFDLAQKENFKWLYKDNFRGDDVNLLNGTTAWNFLQPYPSNSQILVLRNFGHICQNIDLIAGMHNISFYHCNRPGEENPLTIALTPTKKNKNDKQTSLNTTIHSNNNWSYFSHEIYIPNTTLYTFRLSGTRINGDNSVGLDNIVIT